MRNSLTLAFGNTTWSHGGVLACIASGAISGPTALKQQGYFTTKVQADVPGLVCNQGNVHD